MLAKVSFISRKKYIIFSFFILYFIFNFPKADAEVKVRGETAYNEISILAAQEFYQSYFNQGLDLEYEAELGKGTRLNIELDTVFVKGVSSDYQEFDFNEYSLKLESENYILNAGTLLNSYSQISPHLNDLKGLSAVFNLANYRFFLLAGKGREEGIEESYIPYIYRVQVEKKIKSADVEANYTKIYADKSYVNSEEEAGPFEAHLYGLNLRVPLSQNLDLLSEYVLNRVNNGLRNISNSSFKVGIKCRFQKLKSYLGYSYKENENITEQQVRSGQEYIGDLEYSLSGEFKIRASYDHYDWTDGIDSTFSLTSDYRSKETRSQLRYEVRNGVDMAKEEYKGNLWHKLSKTLETTINYNQYAYTTNSRSTLIRNPKLTLIIKPLSNIDLSLSYEEEKRRTDDNSIDEERKIQGIGVSYRMRNLDLSLDYKIEEMENKLNPAYSKNINVADLGLGTRFKIGKMPFSFFGKYRIKNEDNAIITQPTIVKMKWELTPKVSLGSNYEAFNVEDKSATDENRKKDNLDIILSYRIGGNYDLMARLNYRTANYEYEDSSRNHTDNSTRLTFSWEF